MAGVSAATWVDGAVRLAGGAASVGGGGSCPGKVAVAVAPADRRVVDGELAHRLVHPGDRSEDRVEDCGLAGLVEHLRLRC